MNNLLSPQNLLKGFALAIYVNILACIFSIIIGFLWIYMLIGVWDWEHLLYLCLFYTANISFTLLLRKWYLKYLETKKQDELLKIGEKEFI